MRERDTHIGRAAGAISDDGLSRAREEGTAVADLKWGSSGCYCAAVTLEWAAMLLLRLSSLLDCRGLVRQCWSRDNVKCGTISVGNNRSKIHKSTQN